LIRIKKSLDGVAVRERTHPDAAGEGATIQKEASAYDPSTAIDIG
jgi:hypothetical protein